MQLIRRQSPFGDQPSCIRVDQVPNRLAQGIHVEAVRDGDRGEAIAPESLHLSRRERPRAEGLRGGKRLAPAERRQLWLLLLLLGHLIYSQVPGWGSVIVAPGLLRNIENPIPICSQNRLDCVEIAKTVLVLR